MTMQKEVASEGKMTLNTQLRFITMKKKYLWLPISKLKTHVVRIALKRPASGWLRQQLATL